MVTKTEKYYSVADTAVLIREVLKKNFPGTKFSVRSDSYAGGASIDVRWSYGPTVKEVDAVVGVYESKSFDGSIDLACHYNHWMTPDGKVTIRSTPGTEGSLGYIPKMDIPQPEGAIPVHFGSDYVQCARSLSINDWKEEMEFRAKVAQDMCVLNRCEWSGENTIHLYGDGDTEQATQHAWRLLNLTSFKPGEEYAGVRWMTEEETKAAEDPWTRMVIIKKAPAEGLRSQTAPIAGINGVVIQENKEHQGIELKFPAKPPSEVINRLKASGWRWNRSTGVWYTRMSEEAKQFAESLIEK